MNFPQLKKQHGFKQANSWILSNDHYNIIILIIKSIILRS